MEKKNNNLIIIMLTILVLVLTGYIAYDKFLPNNVSDNNNLVNENNDNLSNNNDEVTSNDRLWIDYILKQDIESAVLHYQEKTTGEFLPEKTYNLTKEELASLFSQIEDTSITKRYIGGIGGPGADTWITITYKNDDITYNYSDEFLIAVLTPSFEFSEEYPTPIEDGKLLEIMENNNKTIVGNECGKDMECSIIYESSINYANTEIFKKAFNITE